MKTEFIKTSGVKALLAAVTKAQARGSREASWIAIMGDRGTGKTRALQWWALKHQAVYIRLGTDWSARWLLEELAKELGLSVVERRRQDLFAKVVQAVAAGRIILVLDEVELEKVRGRVKLLEMIRDISDLTEMEVVIGGDEHGIRHILKYDQFASRVAETAQFGLATLDDIKLMCGTLAEVTIADDLAAEILRQSGGYLREAKNAIAAVESWAKANNRPSVAAADVAGRMLCGGRMAAQAKRRAV